jgi:hypothetical protein
MTIGGKAKSNANLLPILRDCIDWCYLLFPFGTSTTDADLKGLAARMIPWCGVH